MLLNYDLLPAKDRGMGSETGSIEGVRDDNEESEAIHIHILHPTPRNVSFRRRKLETGGETTIEV